MPGDDALWLFHPWLPVALGVALVLLGFALRRAALARRRTLARAAILFAAYLVAVAFSGIFALMGRPWLERTAVFGSGALELLIFINLTAIVLFDGLLPVLRLGMADIVSDLSIGAAYILALLWILHRAGVDPTSIVATSAVVTAVLGLSLQATLGNIVGGLAVQLDDSIHVGDWIELEIDFAKDGRDSVDLFDAMNTAEKKSLVPRMRHVPFSRGEFITRQGAEAHRLYILTAGETEVRVLGA